MPKVKTPLRRAAGKLTSAIQKEWDDELGTDDAEESENVMHRSHDFIQAKGVEDVVELLGGRNVSEYLGEEWVQRHPKVVSFIEALEQELKK